MQEYAMLYEHVARYQHVERLGNDEVQGILQGTVWVQEKIDGANLSIAWDQVAKDFIICSRKNVVYHNGECTNKGFQRAVDYIKGEPAFTDIFQFDPTLILRGEFLTKHKVPINEEFVGKVVIFDVEQHSLIALEERNDYRYLTYNEDPESSGPLADPDSYEWYRQTYPQLLWVPAIQLKNPTIEQLQELSKGDSDFCEYREGIVIKNYEFTNKWGFTKWGKVISPVFDEKKALKVKPKLEVGELEQIFVDKFVTPGYVEKEIHKIRDEKGEVSTKDMGRIVGKVPYEIFQDEMWRFLNKNNAGALNFRVWRAAVINKVREYALAYFNGK